MLSEQRTIALIVEILHLPMQHSKTQLRTLYAKLCNQCDFENFTQRPGGARIERLATEETGFSRVTYAPDRITFSEEGGLLTVDSYAARLEAILEDSMDLLGIPLILMEQCTVRGVVTPGAFRSASEFIGTRLMNIGSGDFSVIGRPASVFGFRLVVPPAGDARDSYNIRVEVFARDPKSLYLENTGTFRTPVNRADISAVTRALRDTCSFLNDRLCPFLSLFDVPGEPG
jgi:hypothetical protein